MPHRPSLVRRLGELRRSYTGETDSTLLPTITEGIQSLTVERRERIRGILDAGFETRLLGENSSPPPGDVLRRAVLADANNVPQQQLEAGILFALGRAAPYRWPATTVVAPMRVCAMTRPSIDGTQTVLHLPGSAAVPMIATLLPHVADGTTHGLAGLRVRVCRRNMVLYLADSGWAGSISLARTSFRQWASMLGFARVVTGHEWPVAFEGPPTEPERAVIAAGRVPGPVPMASALLRRLRILGDTMWLTVQPDGPIGIRLNWSGGRTAVQVAAALVHPLAGLPGDQFIVTRTADEPITITSLGADGAATARIVLHQAPLTTPPPFTRIDTTTAWAEFNRVMKVCAPAPPKPAELVH